MVGVFCDGLVTRPGSHLQGQGSCFLRVGGGVLHLFYGPRGHPFFDPESPPCGGKYFRYVLVGMLASGVLPITYDAVVS